MRAGCRTVLIAAILMVAVFTTVNGRAAETHPSDPSAIANPEDRAASPSNDPDAATSDGQTSEATTSLEKADNFFRPYKLGEDMLVLGGYVQASYQHVMDTEFNNDDSDGFVLPNARLTAKGAYAFNSWFGMHVRFNFDVSQGAFLVRDIAAGVEFLNRAIMVDVGQFKVPFSLLELTSESSLQFALPAEVSRLTLGRDRGLQISGEIDAGSNVWLAYQLGVFNGEGANTLENVDSEFLYAARFEIAPLGPLSMGEADLDNSDFRLALSGGMVYIPSVARQDLGRNDLEAREWRYNGALRLKFRGLSLRGEFLGASVTPQNGDEQTESSPAYKRYGFYAQAGYVLPFPWFQTPKFELVLRYDQNDINDGEDGWTEDARNGRQYTLWDYSAVRHIDVGANMYVFDHRLKLSFLYRLTDFLEGPKTDENGDVLIGDAVFVTLQVGWL